MNRAKYSGMSTAMRIMARRSPSGVTGRLLNWEIPFGILLLLELSPCKEPFYHEKHRNATVGFPEPNVSEVVRFANVTEHVIGAVKRVYAHSQSSRREQEA
jgi:hypothetical protein